jgi:hypothetical protein
MCIFFVGGIRRDCMDNNCWFICHRMLTLAVISLLLTFSLLSGLCPCISYGGIDHATDQPLPIHGAHGALLHCPALVPLRGPHRCAARSQPIPLNLCHSALSGSHPSVSCPPTSSSGPCLAIPHLVYLISGALPNSHRSDWLPPSVPWFSKPCPHYTPQ